MHLVGSRNEAAVAYYLNVPQYTGHSRHHPDAGWYHVRGRPCPEHSLIIRRNDLAYPDDVFILTTAASSNDGVPYVDDTFIIWGWLYVREAEQPVFYKNVVPHRDREKAWFVPKSELRSIDTLPSLDPPTDLSPERGHKELNPSGLKHRSGVTWDYNDPTRMQIHDFRQAKLYAHWLQAFLMRRIMVPEDSAIMVHYTSVLRAIDKEATKDG